MNKKLILQIRSLYSLLFAVSLSLSSVAAFAQPAPPRITITMADVPMERVIDAIEKQSSYLFAIDANVNISQKVSVSCTDASVETALTQMVKGTDVAYRIDASNVVLSAVRQRGERTTQIGFRQCSRRTRQPCRRSGRHRQGNDRRHEHRSRRRLLAADIPLGRERRAGRPIIWASAP